MRQIVDKLLRHKPAGLFAVTLLVVTIASSAHAGEDVGLGRFSLGGAAGMPATDKQSPITSWQLSDESSVSTRFNRGLGDMRVDHDTALGMSYGTRLSPTVSLSLTPSISVDKADGVASDVEWGSVGLSLGLNWQIAPNLGLSGTAGAGRQIEGSGPFGPLNLQSQVDVFTGLSLGLSF